MYEYLFYLLKIY